MRFALCVGLRPMGGQRWNVGHGVEMFLTGSYVGTLGPQLASLLWVGVQGTEPLDFAA